MKALIIGALLVINIPGSGHGQGSQEASRSDNNRYIKWIATIPSAGSEESTGLFRKVFNLIVGAEPMVFNNPVNVYATGLNDIMIVNQGDGTIINHKKGSTERVQAFKRIYNTLPSLVGICRLETGAFLFTDSRLNRIYYLEKDGRDYRPFNLRDSLSRPTGIAYSEPRHEIWVAETGAHRLSVFSENGTKLKSVGTRGLGNLEFNFPTYIWIDKSGKIYIVDSMNFRVQVLAPDGKFITSFGQQGDVSGFLARPRGIATDSEGNIYVVDALTGVVQLFDMSGRLLYYFGSQGRNNGQFWMPSGIFIDRNDYIYISDTYNSRIQVFQLVNSSGE